MVIDWEAIDSEPTDPAAVIERALLLNDAAIRDPPIISSKRATSPLSPASQIEYPGADANQIRGPSSIPSADGRHQSQIQTTHLDTGDSTSVHTSTPIDRFPEGGLRDNAPIAALPPFSSSSRHPRSPMRHQTTNDVLLRPTPPSSQRASSSQSTRLLHGHSSSPQPFSSPPPSQHALNTLHHILQLKRQISRTSSSTGPPAVSPSPSCPLRKLYPTLSKEPQPNSLSNKRPTESSADVVAAALNESARLSQGGLGRASASSTPLRVYKKRRLLGDGQNLSSHNEPRRRERVRDSLSPAGPSSPPIAALGHDIGSLLGGPLPELTPSVSGDELDLSYPPSPKPPILDTNSPHPSASASAPLPTEPLRPVEPSEPVAGASSLLNFERLPSEEKESAGLQYVARYCRTLDTDRRALGEAYAPDATFSCPERSLRAQGRDGILDALTTLGDGFFCSVSKLKYEVSFVSGVGTLLVGKQDEEVGYTMNFVLQPGDHEDRSVISFFSYQLPVVLIFILFP
ncbi:hypothetical protein H4582DRAFT_1459071 [Lactarius indigo]|nr:hypothetical protein H4582DRAFT_1459071 [Lactarius indigo]